MTRRLILSFTLTALAPVCSASSAWVALFDGTTPGSLARYDLASNKALPPLRSIVTEPQDAIYSPDGATIYVASNRTPETQEGGQQVEFLNASTGALETTARLPGEPFSLAISSDGSRLFAAYSVVFPSPTVDVASIDTSSGQITATGSIGDSGPDYTVPGRLTISPDNSVLYLTLGGFVVSFDASTLTVTHSLAIPTPPATSSVPSRDGTLLFVPNTSNGNAAVTALSTVSFEIQWNVTAATNATAGPLALNPHSSDLFAADAAGLVAEIALTRPKVVQTFQLPGAVSDITAAPSGQSLIALLSNGNVDSLNISTGKTMILLTVPGPATYESVGMLDSTLLIANQSELLQKIDLQTGQSSGGAAIPVAVLDQGLTAFPSGELGFAGGQNGVTVVSLENTRYVTTISTPPVSSLIAAPNGQAVYAISGNGLLSTAQLWVVNPATFEANEVVTLPINSNDRCAISDDSQTLFYADANGLVEVNTANYTIAILPGNYGAVATSSGQPYYVYVYESGNGESQFEIIDYATGAVVDSIVLGGEALVASQLVVSANGRYGYDLTLPDSFVAVYDFETGKLLLAVGPELLSDFALTTDQQSLVTAPVEGETLTVYNPLTGATESTFPVIGETASIIAVP